MRTKLFPLILLSILSTFSVHAQLQGKKFSANLEGIGEINLKFTEKEYELSNPAAVVLVKGNYKIKDNKITFTDTEGPIACQAKVQGEYKFEFNDGILSLTVIQDDCPGRKSIGTATWKETD